MKLTKLIYEAGIIGCGGAGFPTHAKYNGTIETIIINGAECEPLLQTDRYLMRNKARELIQAADMLLRDVYKRQIQIIISDGLSSSAIEANAARILPVVEEGLKEKGLTTGTPIFVKYGRVGAQDRISELVGAKVVCSFIGERPGLATAESMSAYIAYHAKVGMPEARRTVVSNIHKDGVPAVEAGAYIVELLALILEKQASGVELKK